MAHKFTDRELERPLLEASRCLAVLLGASDWNPEAGYPPAPEFEASAAGLRDYVLAPNGLNIQPQHFLNLFDSHESAEGQLRAIRGFLRERTAASNPSGQKITDIFVFAVSHGAGTRQNPRDLHLISYATEGAFIDGTGLSIRQLASSLAIAARSLRRYIMLDCCFSGAALAHFQSGAAGVATLIAADIRRTAHETAHPDETLSEVTSDRGQDTSGFTVGLSSVASDNDPVTKKDQIPAIGTILLCSSRADDLSSAKAKDGRTLFTSSILRVLKADERIDMDSAHIYKSDLPYVSFARLRDRAWSLMLSDVGESAPYPQLFAPNQSKGDLSVLPLLPVVRAIEARQRAELQAREDAARAAAELEKREAAEREAKERADREEATQAAAELEKREAAEREAKERADREDAARAAAEFEKREAVDSEGEERGARDRTGRREPIYALAFLGILLLMGWLAGPHPEQATLPALERPEGSTPNAPALSLNQNEGTDAAAKVKANAYVEARTAAAAVDDCWRNFFGNRDQRFIDSYDNNYSKCLAKGAPEGTDAAVKAKARTAAAAADDCWRNFFANRDQRFIDSYDSNYSKCLAERAP